MGDLNTTWGPLFRYTMIARIAAVAALIAFASAFDQSVLEDVAKAIDFSSLEQQNKDASNKATSCNVWLSGEGGGATYGAPSFENRVETACLADVTCFTYGFNVDVSNGHETITVGYGGGQCFDGDCAAVEASMELVFGDGVTSEGFTYNNFGNWQCSRCDTDNCNNEDLQPDSAASVGSLFAIVVAAYMAM